MEFRILGPLEGHRDGRALDLGGPKQRALLALLLLEANHVVATERLIDALWDEQPPETARNALHVHVSQLRKAIGRERLATREPGYILHVEPGELDAERCARLLDEGRPDDAVALWRGPALADLASERFAQPEIARLEEERLAALELRVEAELAHGEHAAVLGELQRLAGEHPSREGLACLQMLALYRSGRQTEALETYRALRAALVAEVGVEPSSDARRLHDAILRQ